VCCVIAVLLHRRTFNYFIFYYSQRAFASRKAFEWFERMLDAGAAPNDHTWTSFHKRHHSYLEKVRDLAAHDRGRSVAGPRSFSFVFFFMHILHPRHYVYLVRHVRCTLAAKPLAGALGPVPTDRKRKATAV